MEVLIQLLLNSFHYLVTLSQVFEQFELVACLHSLRVVLDLKHNYSPHFIHTLEHQEDTF